MGGSPAGPSEVGRGGADAVLGKKGHKSLSSLRPGQSFAHTAWMGPRQPPLMDDTVRCGAQVTKVPKGGAGKRVLHTQVRMVWKRPGRAAGDMGWGHQRPWGVPGEAPPQGLLPA